MIQNFFRIAIRSLWKNKVFSFINIFGLAIGLMCFMLITAFVYTELHYDQYPAQAKNIYRVVVSVTGNGSAVVYPDVDIAVGQGMKDAFAEVSSFTRLATSSNFVAFNNKQFKEEHLAFADSNFLQMFSIPLVDGEDAKALVRPNSIVISKAFAKKYFGNGEAIGKTLIIGSSGGTAYTVTGVFDRVPENSHFHFDAFLSMSTWHIVHNTWSNIGIYTYLQLNGNADPKKLETKFPQLVAAHVVPEVQHDMGVSLADAQKSVNTFVFSLQPLTDIHLRSDTKYELEPAGDILYIYIFSALAIFILLLACVNFTNLSTARAGKRGREIGVRKVLGSEKKQLVVQFLTESVVLALLAALFAYALLWLALPYFDRLSNKNITYGFFVSFQSLLAAFCVSTGAGLLAGMYPAFYLSSINTVSVLKGAVSLPGLKKAGLRSGLIVFQFIVSTGLIIATVVVYRQLYFMQNQKLGYNKEQVLYLQDTQLLGLRDARNTFKQALLRDGRIVSASVGTNVPGNPNMDGTEVYPKEKRNSENSAEIHTNIFHVDDDYIPTLGIQIVKGRNFSKDYPSDSFAVVINEAAVQDLGWNGTNPIGKVIVTSGQHEYTVIGVTADFHYASLKQKVAPLMLMINYPGPGLILRIKTADVQGLLGDLKKKWEIFHPGAAFAYYFLDDHFAGLYDSEIRTQNIFSAFALVAIIIASLGLFGISAFVIDQRTKEIGIRKILGATVRNIMVLVSGEFLLLVCLAFIISIPVTWWVMQQWLQEFAYRTEIAWWIFAVAGMAAILIALLTVSFQAIKAAVSNPVKNLRTE